MAEIRQPLKIVSQKFELKDTKYEPGGRQFLGNVKTRQPNGKLADTIVVKQTFDPTSSLIQKTVTIGVLAEGEFERLKNEHLSEDEINRLISALHNTFGDGTFPRARDKMLGSHRDEMKELIVKGLFHIEDKVEKEALASKIIVKLNKDYKGEANACGEELARRISNEILYPKAQQTINR